MNRLPMVRGSAFHPLCRLLEDAGINSARLLHRFGLSPAFAGTEPPREDAVPSLPFSEFVREARRVSGIEEFGLEAGSRTDVHSIGDLGNVLEQSFTVHALIRKFAELMPLINSGSESWFEPGSEAGALRFCHRQLLETGHAQIDGYAIPVFIDGVRLGAGSDWCPKWIALNQRAGNPEAREPLSEARARVDSDFFAFEIPREILRKRLPSARRRPGDDGGAEARLRAHSPPTDLVEALAQTIRAGFGARVPTVEEAAEFVGSSARSLRRQLREDFGTSYREVVERARIREAFCLLDQDEFSIEEISFHLCYSNHANFCHAFRRWTGHSPSEYRDSTAVSRCS